MAGWRERASRRRFLSGREEGARKGARVLEAFFTGGYASTGADVTTRMARKVKFERLAMVKRGILSAALGLMSLAPVVYFWLALPMPHIWQPIFPGAGFAVIGCLLLSFVMSASAAWLGSRGWYIATIAALGTILFLGLRMH
jgi:uncharacterized BrkB/YihY/UPF0761 family membrane protein